MVRVPPADRRNAAVRQFAQPRTAEQVVAADAPLARVAGRPLPANAPLVLVEEDGHLVGVLTAGDLAVAAALHALRSGPSAASGDVAAPGTAGSGRHR